MKYMLTAALMLLGTTAAWATTPTNTERVDSDLGWVVAQASPPSEAPDRAVEETEAQVPSAFDLNKAKGAVVIIRHVNGNEFATAFYLGDNLFLTPAHATMRRIRMQVGPMVMETVVPYKYVLLENQAGVKTVAEVVLRNSVLDVAILKAETSLGAQAVEMADKNAPIATPVHVVGHQNEFLWVHSEGVVLHAGTTIKDGQEAGLADAFVTYGGSGSPVFDNTGHVVGMATFVLLGGAFGYTPVETLKRVMSEQSDEQ